MPHLYILFDLFSVRRNMALSAIFLQILKVYRVNLQKERDIWSQICVDISFL